jgi:hypothetical protein
MNKIKEYETQLLYEACGRKDDVIDAMADTMKMMEKKLKELELDIKKLKKKCASVDGILKANKNHNKKETSE